MKKAIICGSIVIILGLLIALGPKFIFKVCNQTMASTESASSANADVDDCCAEPEQNSCCGPSVTDIPICNRSAQAEIGMGLLIAALGACMIVFIDRKIHFGLLIGVFFSSIIALAIPNFLIGGCTTINMDCRKAAFPALTVESVILLLFSAILIAIIAIKPSAETV